MFSIRTGVMLWAGLQTFLISICILTMQPLQAGSSVLKFVDAAKAYEFAPSISPEDQFTMIKLWAWEAGQSGWTGISNIAMDSALLGLTLVTRTGVQGGGIRPLQRLTNIRIAGSNMLRDQLQLFLTVIYVEICAIQQPKTCTILSNVPTITSLVGGADEEEALTRAIQFAVAVMAGIRILGSMR